MTDRNELLKLQKQARDNGRIANFYFDEEGRIDAVAYLDPFGPGRQRAGTILSLLSFAECERAKTLPPPPPPL
jgi:hypothetical protein